VDVERVVIIAAEGAGEGEAELDEGRVRGQAFQVYLGGINFEVLQLPQARANYSLIVGIITFASVYHPLVAAAVAGMPAAGELLHFFDQGLG